MLLEQTDDGFAERDVFDVGVELFEGLATDDFDEVLEVLDKRIRSQPRVASHLVLTRRFTYVLMSTRVREGRVPDEATVCRRWS